MCVYTLVYLFIWTTIPFENGSRHGGLVSDEHVFDGFKAIAASCKDRQSRRSYNFILSKGSIGPGILGPCDGLWSSGEDLQSNHVVFDSLWEGLLTNYINQAESYDQWVPSDFTRVFDTCTADRQCCRYLGISRWRDQADTQFEWGLLHLGPSKSSKMRFDRASSHQSLQAPLQFWEHIWTENGNLGLFFIGRFIPTLPHIVHKISHYW